MNATMSTVQVNEISSTREPNYVNDDQTPTGKKNLHWASLGHADESDCYEDLEHPADCSSAINTIQVNEISSTSEPDYEYDNRTPTGSRLYVGPPSIGPLCMSADDLINEPVIFQSFIYLLK